MTGAARHRSVRTAVAWGVTAALVVAACTGDDDATGTTPAPIVDDADAGTTPPAEQDAVDPSVPETTVAGAVPAADASSIAGDWLRSTAELDPTVVSQLTESRVIPAGPVSHVEYEHLLDGRRVLGSKLTVHVLADGEVQGATQSLVSVSPATADIAVDEATAAGFAVKAVDGVVAGEPRVEAAWEQLGEALYPAWLVSVSTREPTGAWQVVVDATTGNVLRALRAAEEYGSTFSGTIGSSLPARRPEQAGDACDPGPAPSACVFFNPFAQAGAPVDPSDANDYLFPVQLEGLTASGELRGEYVDTAFDGTPDPPDPEPDGTWAGGVGSRTFEAAQSYYWIDRTQRYMQQLGFQVRNTAPTEIVPLFADQVDNAFFDAVEQRIYMGVGSDGIHASQDAFVVIHEYGHAVLDAQIGTDVHFSSQEIGSYSEGFSDLIAALTTIELHNGDDPACVGGWFAIRNSCFRDLNNTKVYPDDITFQVHDDGELFAAAVWDVFEGLLALEGLTPAECSSNEACLPVRDRMVQIMLGAHYYFAAGIGFPDIANAFVRSNEGAFADEDREVIEQAFAARGLLGDTPASVPSTGETAAPSDSVTLTIDIVHDYRGDIRLTAGVVDADFDPLCEEIVLAEPDGDDGGDNLTGTVDISDSPCAAFVPPSPDQLWYLFAADELSDDEGEIIEFVVNVGNAPYPAIDLPRLIPDGDPEGIAVLVDGSGATVDEEGQAEPGLPVDGQPFITLDITHPYAGDLFVRAGVADADGDIVCSVPIRNPDPSNDSGGLIGSVDMQECAAQYPPTVDRQWFLQVIDTAARDEGTVDQFSLTGPDGALFEFGDVPVTVPDNDQDGVALILTDTGSSNGEAGGTGQTSSTELPAIDIEIGHTYVGDLAITAGVADDDLNALCEVVIRAPDSSDSEDDFGGEFSLAECARFYPPQPGQQWYLFVRDTFTNDVGAVERFTLRGPDGRVFESPDAGVGIPDADTNGVVLLIDGSESMTAGGEEAVASFVIEHPFAGDLYVEIGVADADGTAVCGLVVQEPDASNTAIDLADNIDMSECVALGLYPPGPTQQWYIYAEDTAPFDEGTISAFVVGGPDGEIRDASNVVPIVIPDNSTDGVTVFFDS